MVVGVVFVAAWPVVVAVLGPFCSALVYNILHQCRFPCSFVCTSEIEGIGAKPVVTPNTTIVVVGI